MAEVGLKALKNRLSAFIRMVEAGETVVVTDRGRVVAEIVPPQTEGYRDLREHDAPSWVGRQPSHDIPDEMESWEHRGIIEGWLTPARIRDGSPPPPIGGTRLTLTQLMADLERDRADR